MKLTLTYLMWGTTVLIAQLSAAEAAKESAIYAFCNQLNCADGEQPQAGLVNVGGTFYGTTYNGGPDNSGGVLFSLDRKTHAETVLYNFGSTGDAQYPNATLLATKGALYGTSTQGGAYGLGAVYAFDLQTGAETVLHSFDVGQNDGIYPWAGLVAANGKLFGTTTQGGAHGWGIVFSLDRRTGAEKVVYSFGGGSDGASPVATLLNVNGILYGTTYSGGTGSCSSGCGTVFSFNPKSDAESVVYSFCGTACGDGDGPHGGLIEMNGTLYGTTELGGVSSGYDGYGTVYAVDPATGTETVLHAFQNDGTDGTGPRGSLTEIKGTLYGVTQFGGSGGQGTVFSVDSGTGKETIVHAFQTNDGQWPNGDMVHINDTLYGTADLGGANGAGLVFKISPRGAAVSRR